MSSIVPVGGGVSRKVSSSLANTNSVSTQARSGLARLAFNQQGVARVDHQERHRSYQSPTQGFYATHAQLSYRAHQAVSLYEDSQRRQDRETLVPHVQLEI